MAVIGGDEQVRVVVLGGELGGHVVVGVAVGEQFGAGPVVGGFAGVESAGAAAGDPDPPVQTRAGKGGPEDVLGHRGAADVAGADKADV